MKNLSIKIRITLWFTLFMILSSLVIGMTVVLISMSISDNGRRELLVEIAEKNSHALELDDRQLELEEEFSTARQGITSLVFNEAGELLYGQRPPEAILSLPFEDQKLHEIKIDEDNYFVYDILITEDEESLWLRSFTIDSQMLSTSTIIQSAMIVFPLLLVIAVVGGYLIAKGSLQPIQKIRDTALAIEKGGDLSKRIPLDAGRDELHQLAEAFNQMFARLEENFEAEQNFTADAAHELRTPVATILAQCEYAFENAEDKEALYEVVGAIQKQGYRMARLTEALLRFTRIEQQTESLKVEKCNLSQLLEAVCQDFQELNEKEIQLSTAIEPNVYLLADKVLLRQLIENLIQNAYRYGKSGGWVRVSLQAQDREIILRVEDNGIGIDAKHINQIWNRFYRVDPARSSGKSTGFGLGLALVKAIVLAHGGRIRVESQPGGGSLFSVHLLKE